MTLSRKILLALGGLALVAFLGLVVAGAAQGGTVYHAGAATNTYLFQGQTAVHAQQAVANNVLQCGHATHTISSMVYVTPPLQVISVVPGVALQSPAATASSLAGCLNVKYQNKGLTVSLCPQQAAQSAGLAPQDLRAFLSALFICIGGA